MDTKQRYDTLGGVFSAEVAARQYGNIMLNLATNFGARMSYAQGGLTARVIDLPADGATSTGVTIEGTGPDVSAELDRLKVLPMLSDALRWSLLDGGGAIVIISADANPIDQELNPATLQKLEELRVVSVTEMEPSEERYGDPGLPNYGMPVRYKIKMNGTGAQVLVHESRVVEVPGGPRADTNGMTYRSTVPWAGRGMSPQALVAINRYRRTVELGEKLLERSQQAVHAMQDLGKMILNGQEAAVRARLTLVDSVRNAFNGVAIDKDDSYSIHNLTLSGVKDVINEAQVAVSAETGLPVTILFGRSPGGMNATGDSDWATFFSLVDQLRHKRLGPALERLVSLILAQTQVKFEDVSEDWKIQWNPLEKLTTQQTADLDNKKADTAKKVAEALATLQGTGALSQDEAHAYLESQRMYGLTEEGDDSGASAQQYAGET